MKLCEYKGVILPQDKALASELGVSVSAVRQYNPKKRELMKLGLLLRDSIDNSLQDYLGYKEKEVKVRVKVSF